jgi:hypothetical protein
MNHEEKRLLAIRTNETETSIRRVEGSFFLGAAMGIVMLTAYFLSLRRFVAQQARAKHEVEVALDA